MLFTILQKIERTFLGSMIHCHAGHTGLQDGLSCSELNSHIACRKGQNQSKISEVLQPGEWRRTKARIKIMEIKTTYSE